MRTNFKKIVSFLCLTAMLFTLAVPVTANGNGLIFDMESLGITTGMNVAERENDYVRRDEFAQMVVNMMLQQEVAAALEGDAYFTDISASQYKGAINLLAKMNYISGSGGGAYNPSEYITYGAACKILVHALGYDKITSGPSLDSYQFVAGNIGITDGVTYGAQYLTFRQAMIMLDNALDIGMMVPMYYNDNITPSYEIDEGRTFRSFLNGRLGTGIVKLRGIVTADPSTFLYKPVSNLKQNELQIGGEKFIVNVKNIKGYVGQEVDFYVAYKDYEEEYVTAITPTNNNIVYDFLGSQVEKIYSDYIEFKISGAKYKVKLGAETRYILNNRLELGYNPVKELAADENVIIRTVDNNDDEMAEVVFIYDYTDCIVETVSTETNTITFENGFTFGTTKSIKLDEEKIYFELLAADGNEIAVDNLKTGDVVSVAMSKDKTAVRIVKGTEPVEGIAVSRDGEYLTIDGVEYFMSDAMAKNDIKLGIKVIAYSNFLGTLVDYEEEELDHTYAYVYEYSEMTGMGAGCKVKMLLPEYVSVKEIEGTVDEFSGEVKTSKNLFVRNKSVAIYTTEEKIMFDGVKTNAKAVLPKVLDKPVSYAFNDNGKIVRIDTLSAIDDTNIVSSKYANECSSLNKKTYNATEMIFAKGKGNPFAIAEKHTLAFCVPIYSEQPKSTVSDEDLTVFVQLESGLEYESNGYEVDETNEVADVLVIQRVMNSSAAIPVVDTSDVGVVVAVSKVLSDDKSTEYLALTLLADGKKQKFIVSNERAGLAVFNSIAKNDVVQFTLDSFDQINSVKILQKHDAYYESSADDYMYGEVKDIQYNKVSNLKARRVNKVSVGYTGSDTVEKVLELLVRNPAPVYVIEGKEARIGTLNDIQIGDKVYFSIYNIDSVRAVVINR